MLITSIYGFSYATKLENFTFSNELIVLVVRPVNEDTIRILSSIIVKKRIILISDTDPGELAQEFRFLII